MIRILLLAMILQGCATTIAVVDVAGATVIYAGRTVINTIDAITPDIVNNKESK